MTELKCPHCGKAFTVDETELNSIVQQIRDKEFEKELGERTKELEQRLSEMHKIKLNARENEIKLQTDKDHEKEIEKLKDELAKADDKARTLQTALDATEDKTRIAVMEAVKEVEDKLAKAEDNAKTLQTELDATEDKTRIAVMEAVKEVEDKLAKAEDNAKTLQTALDASEDKTKLAVLEAVKKVEDEKRLLENDLVQTKEKDKLLLEQKDEQIAYYKDLKTRMSTKMVGETLEQHCENQFNQLRATAFQNAYFEKDNDARSGSKGDYIYRECDESGVEIISIMFEMKNEQDETSTKHKNEHFFKELDKDRKEKNCEYAVLVSLLESDSELYNGGIVDVSYKYEKMYVVRPQCFIPIITLLRNAAMNALTYKHELAVIRNQDIDISNFEDNLLKFKDDFSRNYEIAHNHFDKAIDEIDKTIQHLEKVKKELLGSDNQLRIANKKVDEVSVKRLTKDNPTMKAKFEEAGCRHEI